MGNTDSNYFLNDVIGQELHVGRKNIKIKKHLSEGNIGIVFLVIDTIDYKEYALKRILVQAGEEELGLIAKWEAEIYSYLSYHNNIVQKISSREIVHKNGDTEYLILLEYCNGGTLLDMTNRHLNIGAKDILVCFSQICLGIGHLHKHAPPIIHRDLKLENILLNNAVFKVCDLGSSAYSPITFKSKEEIATIEEFIEKHTSSIYRAPEMCDLYAYNGIIDTKVDIWALGCILFTLMFHYHPFETGSKNAIVNGHFSIPTKHKYSTPWLQLLYGMLTVKPSDRLSIDAVYDKLDKLAQNSGFSLPQMISVPPTQRNTSPTMDHHRFRPEPIYIASPNNVITNSIDIQPASSTTASRIISPKLNPTNPSSIASPAVVLNQSNVSVRKSMPSPAGTSLSNSATTNPNRLSGALLMAPAGGLYSSKDKDHHNLSSSTLQHHTSNSLLLMQPTSMFGNNSSGAPVPLMSPTLLNSSTFDEVDNLSRISIASSAASDDNNPIDSKFSSYEFDDSSNFQMPRNRRSIMIEDNATSRKSYDPSMSPDAVKDERNSIFNTNAENNFLKYNLSFLSFADDIARSIAKCTDESLTTPKSKYVRKLIISSWDRGGVPDLFQILLKQPYKINGVVALKSLETVHKLLLDGHQSLSQLIYHSRDYFINMHSTWNLVDKNSAVVQPLLSDMICSYSTFLLERARFHRMFPSYEGNFALSIFMKNTHNAGYNLSRDKWWAEQTKAISSLVNLIGLSVDLGERCIALNSTNLESYSEDLIEFRQQFIISVIDVLHMMFFSASYVLMIICRMKVNEPAETQDLVTLYQRNYSRMQKLFGSQVQQLWIVKEKNRQITCPEQLPNPFKARDVLPPMSNVPQLGSFNQKLAQNFTNYMLNGIKNLDSLEQDTKVERPRSGSTVKFNSVDLSSSQVKEINAGSNLVDLKSKTFERRHKRGSTENVTPISKREAEINLEVPSVFTSNVSNTASSDHFDVTKYNNAMASAQASIGAFHEEIKKSQPFNSAGSVGTNEIFSTSFTDAELEVAMHKNLSTKDSTIEDVLETHNMLADGTSEFDEGETEEDGEDVDVDGEESIEDPFGPESAKTAHSGGIDLFQKSRVHPSRIARHRSSIPSISSVKDLFLFSGNAHHTASPVVNSTNQTPQYSLESFVPSSLGANTSSLSPDKTFSNSQIDPQAQSRTSTANKTNSLTNFLDLIDQTKNIITSISGTPAAVPNVNAATADEIFSNTDFSAQLIKINESKQTSSIIDPFNFISPVTVLPSHHASSVSAPHAYDSLAELNPHFSIPVAVNNLKASSAKVNHTSAVDHAHKRYESAGFAGGPFSASTSIDPYGFSNNSQTFSSIHDQPANKPDAMKFAPVLTSRPFQSLPPLIESEDITPKELSPIKSQNGSAHIVYERVIETQRIVAQSSGITPIIPVSSPTPLRSSNDDGQLDYSTLVIGDRIGIGAFAEVFKGTWNLREVAIKRLLANNQTPESINEFWSEVNMMRKLHHENIVGFLGACKQPACVVTELLEGNLWDLLHNSMVELPVQLRLRMLIDSACGMRYLHSFQPAIVHRDLKSANLLYDKDFHVKVGDFGLSRAKEVQYTMTGQCGTFQWMSPEVMQSQRYTEKADVFSFGIIIWEILFRQIPYQGMNSVQVSIAVITQGMRPPIPSDTPPELSSLMQDCWNTNPLQRPVFDDIIERLNAIQLKFGVYP